MTRHGGRQVIVANERGAVTQICNGVCDDLRLRESSGDNTYSVRVLDKAGDCVACSRTAPYVSNGYGSRITRFDVASQDVLRVRERTLELDGSEVVVNLPPAEAQGPASARTP